MCGIAGIIKKQTSITERDRQCLDQIIQSLSHRGPDFQQQMQTHDQVALAHARLSILDLSDAGKQPFSYKNRYTMVYNGEIFNYLELKTELKAKGYYFASNTDTEVILAAYDYWGKDSLKRFNGMWAFGIWDNKLEKVFCARDRYGIKPFYFINTNTELIFSSEILPLKKYVGSKAEYNRENLSKILDGRLDYSFESDTYIKQVQSLEAGCFIEIDKFKTLTKKHWYELTSDTTHYKTEEEWVDAFKTLFFDSIKLRLRSDVPSATCLSGGLDSSSIVASLRYLEKNDHLRQTTFTHTAYTASFPHSSLDEMHVASNLTERLGYQHKVAIIKPPSPDELLKAVYDMDGPMHALAFYPIWKLYQKIRMDGIKVTLDGQGPDELLGGYLTGHLFAAACNDAIANRSLTRFLDLKRTLMELSKHNKSLQNWSRGFVVNKLKNGLSYLLINRNKEFYSGQQLDTFLKKQFLLAPLPTILQQYDRCSMAHGVECRMPFMDFRLVELTMAMPDTLKLGKGTYKRVVREAMKGILPDAIRNRKDKIGFNAPFDEWMLSSLKEWVLDILNSETFRTSSYFEGHKVSHEMQAAIQKRKITWKQAWELWPKLHLSILETNEL